jgi:hypothetical protein
VLEGLYDAEAEKNESIWRTAPFFVTSFGFIAAALGFLASKAPPLELSLWGGIVYLLLLGVTALAAIAFWWLFEMLRERTYAYLLNGREMRNHALALKQFHLDRDKSESEASAAATVDLRTDLLEQLAEAAATGRDSNKRRARARSLAVHFLMLATALAFFTSGLILLAEKASPVTRAQGIEDERVNSQADGSNPSSGTPQPPPPGIRSGGRGSALPDQDGRVLKSAAADANKRSKLNKTR